MKTLKQFISEQEGLPKLYLGVDGVVADLTTAANKILEKYGYPKWDDNAWNQYDEYQQNEIRWVILRKHENFYDNISYLREGRRLWKFLKSYRPYVISVFEGVDQTEYNLCESWKNSRRTWLINKLDINKFDNILFINKECEMTTFAINEEKKSNLLIDSCVSNCESFFNAGGIAIHHVDAKTTIKELRKIGYK